VRIYDIITIYRRNIRNKLFKILSKFITLGERGARGRELEIDKGG
jgi:hypothetical protein